MWWQWIVAKPIIVNYSTAISYRVCGRGGVDKNDSFSLEVKDVFLIIT